jgi:signal transduction histidine kinase
LLTQAIYVSIFLLVGRTALRRRTRTSVDIALFFGAIAVAIVESRVVTTLGLEQSEAIGDLVAILVVAMPYLLLRLVDDFSEVPGVVKRLAEGGLALSAIAFLATEGTLPPPILLAVVLYFAGLSAYCALAFLRAARRSAGVTRRRVQAAAAGTLLLGFAILVAGFTPLVPLSLTGLPNGLIQALTLASAIAYVVAFAPPQILRRAWQEPELRAFLRRAASLPRLPDTASIVRALQEGAGSTLGARATIGLFDQLSNRLRFHDPHGVLPNEIGPSDYLVWRVFETQRAEYFLDAARAHPALASSYRAHGVRSLLIAPISAGNERLGALEAYTDHQPMFSEDDLDLVRLFADQAALILESRALIDEAARIRAREATRVKDDFISGAAHDLKTPLTTLVAQAQFLERRAETDPSAPPDLTGIRRIVHEAKRLSTLVLKLLDASRLEQGKLVGEREPIDLVELARTIALRDGNQGRHVTVSAEAPVVGSYDPRRIGQLFENLLENAVKYSPEESEVRIGIAQQNGQALIDVSDEGIGIPPDDVPQVFERFHRASNVDDRRYAGMGLGLFICRGIVEQHGGRIWVDSRVGAGSTFHVALPVESRP